MTNESALNGIHDDAQDPDKRERSTVDFPYGDLDGAVEVAKGVQTVGGTTCEWEQLAAALKQAATGGGFRQRALSAKIFGLLMYGGGKVTLTDLGRRICDPKQEKAARAEAFLAVELYSEVYNKFKGTSLPPDSGLEAEMVTLGVAKKQKDKARQVFQRSAQQAGFFWSGSDRLVKPSGAEVPASTGSGTPDPGPQRESRARNDGGGSNSTGGQGQNPLLHGLIQRLPPTDTVWTLEQRRKWLVLAVNIFDTIYEDSGDGGSLKIDLEKGPAK